MVGLVIVSHSYRLGEEIINFAKELRSHDFPLINASGLDEDILGTNPLRITEAIKEADNGQGVIILCDLGSAVMSSEMAIEMMGSPENVVIADAPIVEGAIVGASVNSPGVNLSSIISDLMECRTISKLRN